MRRLGSPLLLILVAGLCFTARAQRTPTPTPTAAPTPTPFPTPPKPGLAVVLQRQAIRENDELEAQVWISNDWDKPLSDVALRLNTPAFLSWAHGTCADWKRNSYQPNPQSIANLGGINANDFRITTVCLKSADDIMVGDFNVSFACEYAWPMGTARGRSFVTTEKTLKSNLLGSDAIAGVPIALAAFIVPGLVFWLVIGLMQVPWNIGSALGDKLIYSVIVSVALLWLISWLKTDLSGSIGLSKLFWFAAAGGVAGVIAGGGDFLVRWLLKRRKAAQAAIANAAEVKIGDEPLVVLEKLLTKYPDRRKPRAVVKAGESQYIGSLMEETAEVVAIIGWFRIAKDNIQAANRAEIINALDQAKSPIEIYNLARRYKLTIEARNGIRESTNGVNSENKEVLTLRRRGVVAEQHFDTEEDEVIVVE
jgi:hypothetical protein